MGDAVNVASRREDFREVNRIKVKRKDEAITIYDELKLSKRTRRAYRARTAFDGK